MPSARQARPRLRGFDWIPIGLATLESLLITPTAAVAIATHPTLAQAPPSLRWIALPGLPGRTSPYSITEARGRLVACDTTPGDPHIYISDAIAPDAVFHELQFDTNRLTSAWGWAKAVTGVTTLRAEDGTERVFVSSSAGVFELDLSTKSLSSLWSWSWDNSHELRAVGPYLLWRVASFGSQSGWHVWSSETGQFWSLSWALADQQANRIVDTQSGLVFGWTDQRGFMWPHAATPLLLVDYQGASKDGGCSWSSLRDPVGSPISPARVFVQDDQTLFAQEAGTGKLYLGSLVGGLRDLEFGPSANPDTFYYSHSTGMVIAGGREGLFVLPRSQWLGPVGVSRGSSSLSVRLSGGPGTLVTLEASRDLTHWTEVLTDRLPASGVFEWVPTLANPGDPVPCTFYRASFIPELQPK